MRTNMYSCQWCTRPQCSQRRKFV